MYLGPSMSIFKFLLKIILLIFLFNNFSTANNIVFQDAGLSEKRLNNIDEIFIKDFQNKEIPVTVIAIFMYDKIVYKKSFGMQDREKQIPMNEG